MTDQELNEAVARKLGCKCSDGDPQAHHDCDQPCHWPDNCPKPNRINKSIAEKLGTLTFDLIPDPIEGDLLNRARVDHYPDYCHSLEAAWEIVEQLKPRNGIVLTQHLQSDRWSCTMWTAMTEEPDFTVTAPTAPEAICLAFLKLNEEKAQT